MRNPLDYFLRLIRGPRVATCGWCGQKFGHYSALTDPDVTRRIFAEASAHDLTCSLNPHWQTLERVRGLARSWRSTPWVNMPSTEAARQLEAVLDQTAPGLFEGAGRPGRKE